MLNDLTLNFDPFTIKTLRNEFGERNHEMGLKDFIMIIKDHLVHWQLEIPNREKKLIRCLTLLFEDIDLNGNLIMEWEEFTNYIIEKAAVLNTMKSKNEEIKSYHRNPMKLNMKFNNPIAKVIYINALNKIAFFEETSDVVHLADPKTGEIIKNRSLKVSLKKENAEEEKRMQISRNKAERAMLLDILFIENPKYEFLVTSSNDGVIRMFRYSSNGFVPADDYSQRDHEIGYDAAQIIMAWDDAYEILYSGRRDGIIEIWDQKSEPQFKKLGDTKKKNNLNGSKRKSRKNFRESVSSSEDTERKNLRKNEVSGHTEAITALLPLPKLQFIATASLDKENSIILWETIEDGIKKCYSGYHKDGVLCLAFNEDLILLISGGIHHEIFIWNPYIKEPIHQLTGHPAPIVSLKFVNNPLHIVSMDKDCNIKIWDVKKFKCTDTISLENLDEKKSFEPQGICMIEKPLRLLIPGKNLYVLDYDKNSSLTSADENVCLCAKFIPSSLCLMTPVGNKIKVWNLLTGEIKKIFSNLTQLEISCVCLDYFDKRFIVGDTGGFIGVYNVNNGALLKTLSRHKAEIIGLMHVKADGLECFISCSINNVIKIHDDKELGESEVLRNLETKNSSINSIIFEPSLGKIIIGGNNGVVGLYEASTGKGNEEFIDPEASIDEEAITSLVYIDECYTVLYSTGLGLIKVLGLPPIVIKHSKIYEIENLDPNTNEIAYIQSMKYCHKEKRLFIADEKYLIKCYDISSLIDSLKNAVPSKDKDKENKIREEIKIHPDCFKLLWVTRAHDDSIQSMEYIQSEKLIVTTCMDKTVKIFNSEDGEYIESLKQHKSSKNIKPVAFKKVESDEIYTPRMKNRIDKNYMDIFRSRREKMLELQRKQELGEIVDEKDYVDTDEIQTEGRGKNVKAFDEYEAQEFNPYYYYENRIDPLSVEDKKSNPWNLYINFDTYYQEFEDKTKIISEELKRKEKRLINKGLNSEESDPKMNVKDIISNAEDPQKLRNRLKGATKNEYDLDKQFLEKKSSLTGKNLKGWYLKESNKKLVSESSDLNDNDNNKKSRYTSEAVKQEIAMRKKLKKDAKGKRKKGNTNDHFEELYKKGMRREMIKNESLRNEKKVKLSKKEQQVAEKLAASLANCDEFDPRILKFLDFQPRSNVKVKKPKNYIKTNITKYSQVKKK